MNRTRTLVLVGLGWCCCLGVDRARAADDDFAQLLTGVHHIPVIGQPGAIIPFGPQAFPLVVGNTGETKVAPVVAAARLGRGRIVAFAHDGYLGTSPAGDVKRLILNSLHWAGDTRESKEPKLRVAVWGQQTLAKFLRNNQIATIDGEEGGWQPLLNQCDVFCVDTGFHDDPNLAEAVRRFVLAGGGLVTAGTGWGWASLNPGKTLSADYLGNRVLAPAGLVVSDVYTYGKDGRFGVINPPPKLASAWESLEFLRAEERSTKSIKGKQKDDAAQASQILRLAISALPAGDQILWPELRKLTEQVTAVPTPENALSEEEPLARVAVAVEDVLLRRLPPEKVKAHPAATGFPFAVPAGARSTTEKRTIDTRIPNWHSLGLYAPAGTVIKVHVPRQALAKNLAVQIGCHTDELWDLPTWSRWPNLCRRATIDSSESRLASPFGGLVYIDVPKECKLGTIPITIDGAVEAPLYVLGKTKLDDWRKRIRTLPGPWAELASPGVIVTVPSKAIRNLDDPEALMKFWNRGVELEDALAMYKPGERKRPERFVADEQISAGYMHSGYPLMCGNDMYDYNVDIAKLRGTASEPGAWGQWHELGHNHQSDDWTPHDAVEVTVNLFTMYVINKLDGVPLEGTRPDKLEREQRLKAIREYLASQRNSTNWDAFEGLLMYFQLVDAFGWEPLQQVFEQYRKLGPDEHPKSDVEKWDQWMVRYSNVVGKNLGPFFVKWKLPVTKKALASIKSLPPWMHSDFAEK